MTTTLTTFDGLERTYEVGADAFTLTARTDNPERRTGPQTIHYERDHDLMVTCKNANRGGTQAGLVLIELGVDGYECHTVRLDMMRPGQDDDEYHYASSGDEVWALTDAIEALTAVRDQIARIQGGGPFQP